MGGSSGCGLCPWSCLGKVGAYDGGLNEKHGERQSTILHAIDLLVSAQSVFATI